MSVVIRAFIASLLLLVVACTRPNPNRCCTDETDCNAKGIPVGSVCEAGLVCRGNQCISQPCSTNAHCDGAAPYCIAELCAEACVEDAHCPGFGEAAGETFCAAGDCVACRDAGDCEASAPVCDRGVCRSCAAHDECESQVCDAGQCVATTKIAYVSPTGNVTGTCTVEDACSIERALAIVDPSRNVMKLLPGSYSATTDWRFAGGFELTVYGPATLNDQFDIYTDKASSALRLRDLTSTASITCSGDLTTLLDLHRVSITLSADWQGGPAVYADRCLLTLTESVLRSSAQFSAGVYIVSADVAPLYAIIDRSVIVVPETYVNSAKAVGTGPGGGVQMTNSIVRGGSPLSGTIGPGRAPSSFVKFSTLYNAFMDCLDDNAVPRIALQNNIIINDLPNAPSDIVTGKLCTFSYNLIKPQSSAVIGANNMLGMDPRFVNAAGNDFHLMVGSPAIDKADPAATTPIDFDGTQRPQGAGRDIGAFEYKPN